MATQAIGAASSILSGITGGKGAKAAAQAQAAAAQAGINEQHNEFAQTQQNFAPFLQGGTQALTGDNGLMALLGLLGNDKQQASYDSLKASPAFTSLFKTGQDTIDQNAAATGGLRGGNNETNLANFGSNTLATVIQQQMANLGGLVNVGVGSAGSLGSLGQQNANSVSTLLGQQGNANATIAAAPWATLSGIFSGIGGNVQGGAGALSGIKGAGW